MLAEDVILTTFFCIKNKYKFDQTVDIIRENGPLNKIFG